MLWGYFVLAYSFITLGVLTYSFIVISASEKIHYPESTKSVAVVVPIYNEDKDRVAECLDSILNQTYPNVEVIAVNDGSEQDYWPIMNKNKRIKFYDFQKNEGKRSAQSWGVVNTQADIIVTVDSDTILDKNAVREILKPFHDPQVGSVAGNVKIANSKDNIWTRMIGARYFNAFLFERRRQGITNAVVCNGGPLSAYRRELIQNNLDDYNGQYFLGQKCHFGDDRRLTAYVHMSGLKTAFSEEAVAYTFIPSSFFKLMKMFLRWKKSFYRETFLAMGYMWKNKILSFEMLQSLLLPFMSLFIRINLLYLCVISPVYIFWYIGIITYMAIIRSIYMIVEEGASGLWNIPYAFMHEGLVYWLNFIALFGLRNNKWGTR